MELFTVIRVDDRKPFLVIEALDATHAIERTKVLDETGWLVTSGYWGSVKGFRARLADGNERVSFEEGKAKDDSCRDAARPTWVGYIHFLGPKEL